MMVSMQEIGIEGPPKRLPGAHEENPFYYAPTHRPPFEALDHTDNQGPGPQTGSLARQQTSHGNSGGLNRQGSIASRKRGESISQMSRRYDFNRDAVDAMGDVYTSTPSPARIPHHGDRSRSRIAEEKEEEDDRRIANLERKSTSQQRPLGRFRSINRSSTDTQQSRFRRGSATSVHKNRFFRRGGGRKESLDGTEQEDLMEQGMANIPESRDSAYMGKMEGRMDPRSGGVGSQAIRMNTDTSYSGSFQGQQPVMGTGALEQEPFRPRPSPAETYEMSRMDGEGA